MPSLVHRPPKLRRHASGQAIVAVNGQTLYFGKFGSRAARKKYRDFCTDWKPAAPEPNKVSKGVTKGTASVKELLAAFLLDAEGKYLKDGKPTSTIGTLKTTMRALNSGFGTVKVRDFGPLRLEQLRNRFVALVLSRSICNRYTRHAVRIFRWGVSREIVPVEIPSALAMLEPLRLGQTKAHENAVVRPVEPQTVAKTVPYHRRRLRSCSATLHTSLRTTRSATSRHVKVTRRRA